MHCLQYLFQISKQTVSRIVCLEIANIEALMENIQVENCIL